MIKIDQTEAPLINVIELRSDQFKIYHIDKIIHYRSQITGTYITEKHSDENKSNQLKAEAMSIHSKSVSACILIDPIAQYQLCDIGL